MTSRKRDLRSRAEFDPLNGRAARVAALDSLSRRDHASGDLRRKLIDKGYDPSIVEGLIVQLREEKLVDDHRYAENFVAYHAGRGQGPLRVRSELGKIGLQGEIVETAIDAYTDWIAQLHRAHQKKFGTQRPTQYADRQRQARFLGYRGFTGAQIRMALGFDTDIDLEP